MILDRAKRRSGQLKPLARGPDGIAARRALAFEHPGFLLLRRGRLSVRIETGMGEGADALQDRRDGRKERLAGVVARIGPTRPRLRATRLNAFPCPAGMPTAAWTSSCARMAAICAGMASGACARSGRMKISKCPSALNRLSQHSPIALAFAPLLVKPIATRTRSGRGASSASKSGAIPSATALSQLSRVSWVIVLTPFKSPVRRWPCHRPEHGRPRTPAREGGQRDSMGVERPQRSEARPRLIPLRGRGGRDRLSPFKQDRRRRTPAP